MRIPTISFGWYQRLTSRERVLTLLVGGTVFFILNLFALNFLIGTYRNLSQEYADGKHDLQLEGFLAKEQPMWVQRNQWLKDKQPPLTNRDRAGTALLEQVQNVGRAQQVLIAAPQIKPPPANPSAAPADAPQAVTVEVDTQADWKETVRFLAALQQPESFVVFDLSTLRSNPADPKQMKGHFLISKWYAPRGK